MSFKSFAVSLFFGLFFSVCAVAERPTVFTTWVQAQIDIEADGQVSRVDFLKQDLGDKLTESLRKTLQQPSLFTPGKVDGQLARTQVGVSIQLRAETLLKQKQTLFSIANISLMPLYSSGIKVGPEYPMERFKANKEGSVFLGVSYDTKGKVHEVTVLRSEGGKSFERAATRWASNMRFVPESVGGVGVAGSVRVPVYFKIGTGEASYFFKMPGGQKLMMRPGDAPPALEDANTQASLSKPFKPQPL